jgi:hypothetical protein
MTVDTQKSLLTSIYNLLTADAALKAACGGTVRLYPVWAEPDATFPYLVHRIDFQGWVSEYNPLREGKYLIDLWSYSVNADEILAIRTEVLRLLNGLTFSTTEVDVARTWLQTDGFVPESTQGIWHYAMQFTIWAKADSNGQPLHDDF